MSAPTDANAAKPTAPRDFIREIVAADIAAGRRQRIVTRFPPEPNGYLHIGHAKAICLNFGIARDFHGQCNLRMDDTNPAKEDVEYVDSITEDVRWLIGGWADACLGLKPKGATPEVSMVGGREDVQLPAVRSADRGADSDTGASRDGATAAAPDPAVPVEPFFASDYFEPLYTFAVRLVKKGLAYVCDLSPEDTDAYRGAPDRPGRESPFRNRGVAENLDLFARMRKGEFRDGARTLRARIDMASPNIWMRDPLLYRIRHTAHHHAGDRWCIYPMYDFAHCLSDYIEGITHSICTLEFEVHRPLYDWILENLDLPRPLPRQYEFARLSLGYTIMSKRKLLQLVAEKRVTAWDDPRMPTISAFRRRGVRPEALRDFALGVGVTKYDSLTDVALLEHCIRDDLNRVALRRLAVLRPLKVILTNLPDGHFEEVTATNNPEDPSAGTRSVPFGRELFIEHDDFQEKPPKGFFRLQPGGEVRLKYAGIIRCDDVVKDSTGAIVELRCTFDEASRSGGANSHRKVKGTIHWVSVARAIEAEVRLYDRLFTVPEPDAEGDFQAHLNPHSLEVARAQVEPALAGAGPTERYQFERLGYFTLDPDTTRDRLVFCRTISLKDSWAKESGNRESRLTSPQKGRHGGYGFRGRTGPLSHTRSVAIAGLLALLCMATACNRSPRRHEGEGSGEERAVTTVHVAEVGWRPMERVVTALGTLKSLDRATLSIKTTGRLASFPVDVGSAVKAGEVVARIEPRDYELKVQQAAALLAQARARLGLPLEGDDDQVDLEKTSTVRQARALFEEAKNNLERIQKLESEHISSQAELERAQADDEVNQNQYLDALQDAHERQAVLAQRRAGYEIARQELADTALRAPFDGVVQERLTNLGEYLTTGSPVLSLVRTDPLRLQADIPERLASRVRAGQRVRMTLQGDTNLYSGILGRVSPALDERTRMLRVEAEFRNPGHLRPGRFARVDIVVQTAEPTLVIPGDAVATFAGTEKAFLVETNTAREQRIVVGRREDPWVEVVQGLQPGEKVVLNPGGLQSGDRVEVSGPEAKPSS